jgi:DNA segregation ATPase FtsK/SpoIIIE, S-DNA-T family
MTKNDTTITKTCKIFDIDVAIEGVLEGARLYEYRCTVPTNEDLNRVAKIIVNMEYALTSSPLSITPETPSPEETRFSIIVPKNEGERYPELREMVTSGALNNHPSTLSAPIGETITGDSLILNLGEAKHILQAGTTGSGKSMLLHSLICSLMKQNTPETLQFVLIDPKRVEMTLYDGIPYLSVPVIVDSSEAANAFLALKQEMNQRLALTSDQLAALPKMVVIVDECSDLMVSEYASEIEESILTLVAQGHTVGIHLILSTSRPSTNVYTDRMREAFPSRIVGNVASSTDAKVMLNTAGAERLMGRGDMLLGTPDNTKLTRFQAFHFPDAEITANIEPLKSMHKTVEAYDVSTKKIVQIPIDKINIGETDMETYDKSESYIHVFKCQNEECRLEFMVLSWLEN